MTTKEAALLAAIASTLFVFDVSSSSLLSLLQLPLRSGLWHHLLPLVHSLQMVLVSVVLSASLPVFFVCAYFNGPPMVIPERLRRPALVAALATGISAAQTSVSSARGVVTILNQTVFTGWNRTLIRVWNWNDLLDLFRDNSLRWSFIGFPLSLFYAITLPLFFFTVWKSVGGNENVKQGLKMAAVYAGLSIAASEVFGIYQRVWGEIYMWTHQALLAQSGRPPGAGLWSRILRTSLGLFYSGSLAWFFFLFYKKVPTTQSNQRLSSGE